MNKKTVFLCLGSNKGDREGSLRKAVQLISEKVGEIVLVSSLYETEPWGFKAEQNFLNGVIKVKTPLSPEGLMKKILLIEKSIGRKRESREYESRLIDIDILFYANEVIHTPDLRVPHPLIKERRFVLEPLSEIAGKFKHPLLNITIADLLSVCEDKKKVIRRNDHLI